MRLRLSGRSGRHVRSMFGLTLLALGCLSGCQTSGAPSAAEATASAPQSSRDLEFFDELDRRPVASQDDLLQGMLLVRSSAAPADHAARVAEAKRLGIVDASYSRPARGVVTVEQASAAAAGALGARDFPRWQGDATRWAKTEGLVPQDVRGSDELTGGQLLAILGGVSDMLATRPAPTPAAPASATGETDAFDQFTPVATKAEPAPPPVQAATSPVPTAAPTDAPKPRPEPLPEMKLVESPAASPPKQQPAPVATPAPAPARATVDTTAQERPATPLPKPAPLPVPKPSGNPWASGRPVGG